MRSICLLTACLVLSPPLRGGVSAAEEGAAPEVDVHRLARDQKSVRDRLDDIEGKMSKLAAKLRAEGKGHSADLLEKAVGEIVAASIKDQIERIGASLEREEFGAVEQQGEVLSRLESIYAILLDRASLDQIEEDMKRIKEALGDLRDIKNTQQQLTKETAAAATDPRELLRQAAVVTEELQARQRELSEQAENAARSKAAQLAALREQLAAIEARQAAAAQENDAAIEERAAGFRVAEAALQVQAALAKRLAEEAARAAEGEQPVDPATLDALKKVAETHDNAQRILAKESETASEGANQAREAMARALEDAARSAQTAREALEAGDRKAAAEAAAKSETALGEAKAKLDAELDKGAAPAEAAQRQAELAEQMREIAEQTARIAKESDTPAGDAAAQEAAQIANESAEKATDALQRAAESAGNAGEALAKPELTAASEAQREALEALREARRAVDAATDAAREQASSLAEKQDYLANQTAELKETLERAEAASQPEAGDPQPSENASKAEQAMAKAAGELARSAQPSGSPPPSGSEGEPSEQSGSQESPPTPPTPSSPQSPAAKSQQEAQQQLDEVARRIEEMRAQAEQKSEARPSPADQQSKFDELERRQREVEEQTRDLMKRIADEKKAQRDEALRDAASKMEQAGNNLERDEGEDALERQKEAEKYLNKAEKDLKEEEERYQNLRQEELLFKVKEHLVTLRAASAEMVTKTEELDLERGTKGKLSRLGQTQAKKLATKARELRTTNEEVIGRLKDDGAVVFTYALESNTLDFDRVAELLGTSPYRTDDFTRSLERDIVERYDSLLATLDEELERRKQAKVDEPEEEQNPESGEQQQPQEGPQPLIPPVAELLLIKRMEERIMRSLDTFQRAHPELGSTELDRAAVERLSRLGIDHSKITQLFETLVDGIQEPPAEPEPEGPKDAATSQQVNR
jgi:hypothetical protein